MHEASSSMEHVAASHLAGEYGAHYPEYYGDYYNYTYEYEYDASMTHLPLSEFLPTVIVYSVIGLWGLVGNLLVIFSIARVKRMRSITNLFLLSLASADLLLVCVCVPVRVSQLKAVFNIKHNYDIIPFPLFLFIYCIFNGVIKKNVI